MKFTRFLGVVAVAVAASALADTARDAWSQTPAGRPPARVAIVSQRGFPSYGIGALPSPIRLASDLRAAGLDADILDIDALANASTFSNARYSAVILPYGNTFPKDAFANLHRFHEGGGSLVMTGIPFTHGVVRKYTTQSWSATPGWGESVDVVPGAGFAGMRPGSYGLLVVGATSSWVGASSARFDVRPGETIVGSAQVQNITRPPSFPRPQTGKLDSLFVRFFGETGTYLSQVGASVNERGHDGTRTEVRVTAPERAAFADLSFQVQRANETYFVSDFAATRNGSNVAIANADFTRRDASFVDTGHASYTASFEQNGIGIGGFAGPARGKPAPATISPGDPLKLRGVIAQNASPNPSPQWLDLSSLPAGVRAIPAVGDPKRPLVALIVHEKGPFAGAVDAWTFRANPGEREEYDTHQILERATVAALARRGVLSPSQRQTAFAKLDALPRPAVYANVGLPVVPRRYTTFQPKMPAPSRHLLVADVRTRSADEKLLLISLQGVVNRKQPRLYLLFDDDDRRWLEEMRRQGATDEPTLVADPFSLLETFRSEFKGAVVCDPGVYVSPCVAASLAGADDVLVARTAELAARWKLPIAVDLRGKFKDDADALHYLRTSVLPRLDPYLSCSLDPAVFGAGGLDSVIAARGSVFWITGPLAQDLPGANQAGEMEEVRAMFARMPLGAVVRGFWWHGDGVGLQEDAGVALGSRFGKVTLVSDLITNLSVHSGVPTTKLEQKPRPPAPAFDPKKVYVCFTMSDGDNLCTWRGYFRRYFDDPVRGSIPVGWGMSPAILDLAPDWARWYYEHATENDEFICDVSGVAYMYPPSWATALKDRDAAFRFFYSRTAEYMGKADMKTVRLMDVRADDIAKVGPLLPGIDFLMPDYGHAGITNYADLTYTLPGGQAIFRAATSGSGPEHFAEQIRDRAGANRPAFVNAFIWNWGSNLGDLKGYRFSCV